MGYGVPDRCPPPSGSPLLNSWTPPASVVTTTTTPQPWSSQLYLPSSGQACPVDNVQYPTSGCTAYDITLGDIDSPVEVGPFFVTYVECVTGREITIAVTEGSCFRVFAKNGTTPVSSPEEIVHPINGGDGGGGWGGSGPDITPAPCEIDDEDTQPPPVLPPSSPPEPPPPGVTTTTTTTTTAAPPEPPPTEPPGTPPDQEFTYQTRILTLGIGNPVDEETFLDESSSFTGDNRWYVRSFEPQMYYLFNSYQFDADDTDYSKAIDSQWIYNWLDRPYVTGRSGGPISVTNLDNLTLDENRNKSLPSPPNNVYTYENKRSEDLALDINYNRKGRGDDHNEGGLLIESYDESRGDDDKLKYYFIGTMSCPYVNTAGVTSQTTGCAAGDTTQEQYARVAFDSLSGENFGSYYSSLEYPTKNGQPHWKLHNLSIPVGETSTTRRYVASNYLYPNNIMNFTSRPYGVDPFTNTILGQAWGESQFTIGSFGFPGVTPDGKINVTGTYPTVIHYALTANRAMIEQVTDTGIVFRRPDGSGFTANREDILNQVGDGETFMVEVLSIKYESEYRNKNLPVNERFVHHSSYSRCKARFYVIGTDGAIRHVSDEISGNGAVSRTSYTNLGSLYGGRITERCAPVPSYTTYFGDQLDTGDIFNVSIFLPTDHPSGVPVADVKQCLIDQGTDPEQATQLASGSYTRFSAYSDTHDGLMQASGCVPKPPISNWMLIDYINDMRSDYE